MSWIARLHHGNLIALSETRPELRPVPSYSTLRRFLKSHGPDKRRRGDAAYAATGLADNAPIDRAG